MKFFRDLRIYIAAFAAIIVAVVYRQWISNSEIIGGDWPYFFIGMIRGASLFPAPWGAVYGGGLGGVSPAFFLIPYMQFTLWLSGAFHIAWPIVYKLFWFILPLLSNVTGSYLLVRRIFPRMQMVMRLTVLIIFVSNTYILMIASGGQMGVFWSVSVTAWVYWAFFSYIELFYHSRRRQLIRQYVQGAVVFGLALGAQIALDPRIGYVSLVGLAVLTLAMVRRGMYVWPFIQWGGVAGLTAFLLNAYWTLPLLLVRSGSLSGLDGTYTSVGALRFFSFADFSHALSLLHPNWPENIFGKTYFLQPEFLILPLFAFGALLTLGRTNTDKNNHAVVLGFSAIGLLGAFLAKGANEPFGILYEWLFMHVPGFVMFRDPTKFYVLIVVSYAVLIPVTLDAVAKKVNRRWVVPMGFLLIWLILIRSAVSGSLGGTFTQRKIPASYQSLATWQSDQSDFFRTLWVPRQSRFTYIPSSQLPLEAGPLLGATDAATLQSVLGSPDIREHLSELGIRYVIVPADPYGEIFQTDRKYNEAKRRDVVSILDTVPWLTTVMTDEISVYRVPDARDHFWINGEGSVVSWKRLSDDQYEVRIQVASPSKLMFSESYNSGWYATDDHDRLITARRDKYGLMSFAIQSPGLYSLRVIFGPRQYYIYSRMISIVSLLGALGVIWYIRAYGRQTHKKKTP